MKYNFKIMNVELLNEIKSMSEEEVNEMLNENKLSLEKIAIELTHQRGLIEKLNNNVIFINDKLDNVIKINNLKIK